MNAGNANARPDAGSLFEVVPLPAIGSPVFLAVAFPAPALTAQPGFPAPALPQSGRVASGRGLSLERCRTSAIGEAAELASCCEWGDEPLVTASAPDLGPKALAPKTLIGLSDSQTAIRRAWNSSYGEFDWWPPPHDPTRLLDWLEVQDAYGGPGAYVPADFAFIGRKQKGDAQAVAIGDSNGCACGPDADSAKLAAILELIERDAVGRWWYGRRRRPTIDMALLDPGSALVAWLGERARISRLFDVTSDLGVPVAVAASAELDGSDVALGFGADTSMRQAAVSALTEMVQMEVSLDAARAMEAAAGFWAEWRQRVTMLTPPLDAANLFPTQVGEPEADHARPLAWVLETCKRCGVPLWLADMTRKTIAVPAFRAISPVLCYTKPRFDRSRLLAADGKDRDGVNTAANSQVPLLI